MCAFPEKTGKTDMLYTRFGRQPLVAGTKLVGRGWIFAVYDRETSCQQCTDRGNGRMRMRMKMETDMKLTSLQSITDFMTCAGRTIA